ncbi:uncharacterized protein [Eucyclogobius newberryi]|uniref:uncharacterized protein n=1 Tax=Eucyclogobius newberryi TaxID=166745 RepID=UPI003B59CFD1
MEGMKVKHEVDTWGPEEPGFSQNHDSHPRQKPLNPVVKSEVLTDIDPNHELPQQAEDPCIEHDEEPSALHIIPVKTEDGADAWFVQGESPEEEDNDKLEDFGELDTDSYGDSSDTESSMTWDGELGAKLSTGRDSDSSFQTDNEERSEDWIQKWKVDDEVCYPVRIKGNKLQTHSVGDQGETEAHKCSECGKTFTDKLYLKRHMVRHTGRRPFQCSVCKKRFTQNAHLRKHMRCHTGEKPFNCPVCDAPFSLKQNLHRHMTSHSGAKSFSCPICKKGFTQKCHLSRHMSIHLGEKLCTCPDETCEHTQSVNGPIIAVTAEKPFVCPFCSKGFTRKDHLSSHLSAHTGDKQFDCPECDAKFNLKQSLDRHMTVHSGEKPFKCPDCQKGFTRNSTLKLHMRTHTGEKPFSCTQCDAKFNRKENFLRHLTVHTGERPYSCPVCKKDFVRKPSLDKHMKSHTVNV